MRHKPTDKISVKAFEPVYSEEMIIEHNNHLEYRVLVFARPNPMDRLRVFSLKLVGSKRYGFYSANAFGLN